MANNSLDVDDNRTSITIPLVLSRSAYELPRFDERFETAAKKGITYTNSYLWRIDWLVICTHQPSLHHQRVRHLLSCHPPCFIFHFQTSVPDFSLVLFPGETMARLRTTYLLTDVGNEWGRVGDKRRIGLLSDFFLF